MPKDMKQDIDLIRELTNAVREVQKAKRNDFGSWPYAAGVLEFLVSHSFFYMNEDKRKEFRSYIIDVTAKVKKENA